MLTVHCSLPNGQCQQHGDPSGPRLRGILRSPSPTHEQLLTRCVVRTCAVIPHHARIGSPSAIALWFRVADSPWLIQSTLQISRTGSPRSPECVKTPVTVGSQTSFAMQDSSDSVAKHCTTTRTHSFPWRGRGSTCILDLLPRQPYGTVWLPSSEPARAKLYQH